MTTETTKETQPTTEPKIPAARPHHKFGPSRLNYLDECAAFTNREGQTSEAADQGTFLHDICDVMVKQVASGQAKTMTEQIEDWVLPNNEVEPDEEACLRYVARKVDAFLARRPTKILSEIKIVTVGPGGEEMNHGYLDLLLIFGKVGVVIDYKFGWKPVPAAEHNLQGMSYVLGTFQGGYGLTKIGACFVQPKIGRITEFVFSETDIPALQKRIHGVIENAKLVQANPEQAQKLMKTGDYCDYCALAGTCALLNSMRQTVGASVQGLIPLPPSFKGRELIHVKDIALARYWVDIVERGVAEIKQAAFDAAQANGGSISCTLPNGEEVVFEIAERGVDRVIGDATLVADALKDSLTPAEVLSTAKLSLASLEKLVRDTVPEIHKARTGEKLTKKAAWEDTELLLTGLGLLSRPDTKIKFLQRKQTKKETKGQ